MAITERIAEFVATARLTDLPAGAIDRARLCLLDTLGVAVRGADTAAARIVREYARATFAPGPATILGTDGSLAVDGAALANGVSASALDMDDGHRVALAARTADGVVGHCAGHPGAVVVPAALAAAEQAKASGAVLLLAILVGYEVGIRIAAARRIPIVLENATGNWGAYAAAVATGKVLGLSPPALADALGMAASFGPNPQPRVTFKNRAVVVIRTRTGEHVEAVEDPRGDPGNPLTVAELTDKFRRLTRRRWTPARAERVRALVARIEAVRDVSELSRLLQPDVSAGPPPDHGPVPA